MKTEKATVSLYLDTRRVKGSNKFPVKLRVYFNNHAKLYYSGEDITDNDFKESYLNPNPKKVFKELKIKLSGIEGKAQNIIDELKPFTFELFEKKMFRHAVNQDNVFFHYDSYISILDKEGRAGTSENYVSSMKSIKGFITRSKDNPPTRLSFQQITPEFLRRYEAWMLEKGKKITTVGIYLRPLRAIFNKAIEEGDIPIELYPFGKKRFQIPAGRNIKKALNGNELSTLFNFRLPANSILAKGRDFWFFSYCCNGMNIRDIAELKYSDLHGNRIVFTRTKTKNSTRTNLQPITIYVTDFISKVIAKYGNKRVSEETYIFPIISEGMTAVEKRKAVKNFTRFINERMKTIAESAGLNSQISSYWARHSFTTSAIRNGARMEHIQESLGHQSMATTKNYWGGFEDEVKKGIAEKLMQF